MITVAIVGMGGMGKTHITSLAGVPFARITDICDVDEGSRKTADELGAAFYTGLDDMLAHSRADTVILCTPTFLHYDQICGVLRAKKHCISEKPLCLTSKQARELFAMADANGVRLFVAQVLHFWEQYALLADLIKSGAYGRIIDLYLYRLTQCPAWSAGGWMLDKSKSGLLPFDLHIHDLDFIVSQFGKPRSAHVQSGGSKDATYKEYYRIAYEFEDLSVCAEASWYNAAIPFSQGFRAYFERGLVVYDGKDVTAYGQDGQPEVLLRQEVVNDLDNGVNVPPTYAYLRELTHFLGCLRDDIPSDKVTREQIITTIEILETLEV